jgi:parallel beta-helix repeat protein
MREVSEKMMQAGEMEGRSTIFRWIGLSVLTAAALFWVEFAQAAPTLVQKKSGSSQDSASVAATFDAAPTSGNLLIAIAANRQTSTPATPAGWSVAIDQSNFAPGGIIYYRIAGASEPTTVTVNGYNATNQRLSLQLFEYSGVDTLDQVNTASGNGTAVSSGSVTTTRADELVIAGVASTSSTSYSAWSNAFAEQHDFVVGGFGTQITAGGADFSAVSTGTYSTTATAGGSGNWRGVIASFSLGGGATLSGRVFEDANFSGTASDWDGGANDLGLNSVDVELYDNSNNYLSSTTTVTNGGFPGYFEFTGLSNGTYKVRVRSATLGDADTTPKGGLNACVPASCAYPLAEMTWGNGAALYGGQSATVDDTATGDNGGPGDTYLSVTVSGANVSNVHFGFAYNLIVNKDDDSNAVTVRSKQGSLRQFIKNANAIGTAGSTTANSSQFRIPAGLLVGGVATIQPPISLPTLTDNGTTLDATTQTANIGDTNAVGPEIEIDGSLAAVNSNGIIITSANNTLRGLVINSFTNNNGSDGDGIDVIGVGATGNTLAGNYIGLDATGTIDKGNADDGIRISDGASGNTVGGTAAADRNLISGNGDVGILFYDGDNNIVYNNYIGPDRTGTTAFTNSRGIRLDFGSTGNIIGGSAANQGNLISGNANQGIYIFGTTASNNNVIKGNKIGTKADGISALANGTHGIEIAATAANNTIGGTAAGEGNTIAFNTSAGIYLDGANSDNNKISGNALFGNGGLGIDLAPAGVGSGNGANNNKAAPVLTTMTPSGANFITRVSVTSGDTVEFFRVNNAASPAVGADGTGYGEGYLFLGSCVDNGACSGPHLSAAADADGAAGKVTATLLSSGLISGDRISATAIDGTNGTSEFGRNMLVPTVSTCQVTTTSDGTAPVPAGSLRDCINWANSNAGQDTILFDAGVFAPGTINVTAALPTLTDASGAIIDGSAASNVLIDGSTPASAAGFTLNSNNNQIKNLTIRNFKGAGFGAGSGVYLQTNAASNTLSNNTIQNNQGEGIYLDGSNTQNTISGNTISGNTREGINILTTGGSCATRNSILSNTISNNGTGATKRDGIRISNSACELIDGNTVNGNGNFGIFLSGASTTGVIISNNSLSGNNPTGEPPSGTIGVFAGANANRIEYNILKDNEAVGILIGDSAPDSQNNIVEGNLILRTLLSNTSSRGHGIMIYSGGNNTKIYQNTVHGNQGHGVTIGGTVTGFVVKNNLFSNNTGAGLNAPASAEIAYNDYYNNTGGSCTGGCANGTGSITTDPQYINPTSPTDDFHITECSSPAINAGVDLAADQPDMNGGGSGNYNGSAPDMGSLESSCGAILSLVKQVWQVGGSAPLALSNGAPTSTTVPSGQTIVFLIYVKNPNTTALADIRFSDLLDVSASGFDYVPGSLVRDDGSLSDAATDLQIFNATAPGTGTALTDAVDGDIASVCDSGAGACPGTTLNRVTVGNTTGLTPAQANGTLLIPANKTFAIRFRAVKK